MADLSGYALVTAADMAVVEQVEEADRGRHGQAYRFVLDSRILRTKRVYPVVPAARAVVQS